MTKLQEITFSTEFVLNLLFLPFLICRHRPSSGAGLCAGAGHDDDQLDVRQYPVSASMFVQRPRWPCWTLDGRRSTREEVTRIQVSRSSHQEEAGGIGNVRAKTKHESQFRFRHSLGYLGSAYHHDYCSNVNFYLMSYLYDKLHKYAKQIISINCSTLCMFCSKTLKRWIRLSSKLEKEKGI